MTARNVVRLIMECPVDIAYKIGFDKLTPLHNTWIFLMVFGKEDKTLQGHRGSFKTTCLSIAFAFICLLYPRKRTIFMRKTDTDVAEVMAAVSNILRTDHFKALSRMLYGVELVVTKATQSEVNTNLAKGVSGASQILGLGCGSSLTGKHADFVFTDDIINIKDRVSMAERERIKLIYQELQNIRNRGGRIFNTGTPWHKDDAFSLMPNLVQYDCYSTGLMSKEEIADMRNRMSVSMFAANYELKHIADAESMFKAPTFCDNAKLLYNGFGHIDASYGGEDSTAYTAIRRVGDTYVVYGRLWHKHVDDCLDEIVAINKALRIGTIYCENNADKGYLAKKIRTLGLPCKDYYESTNKHIKISSYLREAWEKVYFLDCPGFDLDCEYLNQILDYNEYAEHDDAPDSLASAIRQLKGKPKMKTLKGGL
ncbi:MAG: hypothetical protein RR547_04375 [Raoultibacter sp.]